MTLISPDRSLTTQKRKLRELMHTRRMQMPHAAMMRASESVALHFADHPILAFAPSFAGYLAIRGEVDVKPVFQAMGRFGRTTQFIGSGLVQVQQLGAQRRIEAFRVMRNHAAASVELAQNPVHAVGGRSGHQPDIEVAGHCAVARSTNEASAS